MSSESETLALKARIDELESRLKFIYRRPNIEYADRQ